MQTCHMLLSDVREYCIEFSTREIFESFNKTSAVAQSKIKSVHSWIHPSLVCGCEYVGVGVCFLVANDDSVATSWKGKNRCV